MMQSRTLTHIYAIPLKQFIQAMVNYIQNPLQEYNGMQNKPENVSAKKEYLVCVCVDVSI